jgi:XTP/dITP diphosphohydrolase
VATKNPGKLVEIQAICSGLDLDLIPLSAFARPPDVVEDGLTYQENAIKKACNIAAWSGRLSLADDSGLEVATLGGQPGVYTARFGGPGLSPRERCERLLDRMRDVPAAKRQATFRCVAALADPAGYAFVRQGQCHGVIGHILQGDKGFGYDPIFFLPAMARSFAELSPQEKDLVSHRAHALRAMMPLFTALRQGRRRLAACQRGS